jgi:hypothetical protein
MNSAPAHRFEILDTLPLIQWHLLDDIFVHFGSTNFGNPEFVNYLRCWNRISSVSTVTRLRAGWPRFDSRKGQETFRRRVQTVSGAHPASYPMGIRCSFPEGKAAGREANHSLPSSAEVKNAQSYTSTPPVRLHGVVLNWARSGTCLSNFTFT